MNVFALFYFKVSTSLLFLQDKDRLQINALLMFACIWFR